MATDKQQRFYQLSNGMWIDAMTGQQAPELLYLKEALIEAASPKAQAQAAKVEREYPEQYRSWLYDPANISLPKPSDYNALTTGFNRFATGMADPFGTFGLPDTGKLGGALNIVESFMPTTYVGKGMQEGYKGNAASSAAQFGLGFASIFPATTIGRKTSQVASQLLGRLPFVSSGGTVDRLARFLGSNYAEGKVANKADEIKQDKEPVYPYAQGSNFMTADQMERRAAMERNRTDAAGNSGMGGRNTVYTDGVRPPGGYPGARPELNVGPPVPVSPSAPIARVPMPALNPPTPEEQAYYGDQLTGIDKLYKQTLADIAQEQEQGQLSYARVGQTAQRRAAGSAQDLANQMAGSSIGGSPAAAFGAEQMVQAPLVQQRQANRLNLDQLLSQLQKKRTQAGTAMDMSKVGLNRWLAEQRAANTRSQIESGYQNSLGGM